jgi:multiple sugar transport system ATP-binding protein
MGWAIVRKPIVFLFDEPLSYLDAKLQVDMRTQIKRLRSLLQTTTVYVTHDQVEALTLADRIVIRRDGRIEHQGKPIVVYKAPVKRFVAEFIGSPQMNMLAGVLTTRNVDNREFNVTIVGSQLPVGSLLNSAIGIRPNTCCWRLARG